MNELLLLGAFELAELIRTGRTSSEDVVRAHIDRIREVNPALNAVVEERFEAALDEAREADVRVRGGGDLPALLGVPFTVKEMLAVASLKSTAGSAHRRARRSSYDATTVARLRRAGAIVLGTTNVPELGFWFETDNPVYGRTNNPYDLSRTCGGSSGGEGAIIGAGGSPFGVGSDIGGSIRTPAAFCGISGHKPTNRWLPLTGHFPYELDDMPTLAGRVYPYTSLGPLARRARDLRPLMEILIGPDEHDRETLRDVRLGDRLEDVSRIRVHVLDAPVFHLTRSTDEEMRQATRTAASLFEQFGAGVETWSPKIFVRAVEMWVTAIKSTKDRTYAEILNPEGPVPLAMQFLKAFAGRADYTIPSLFTVLVEQLAGQRQEAEQLLKELADLRMSLTSKLSTNGILLLPPHPRTAPKHRAPWLSPFDFIYAGIFNVLGFPATVVPLGKDSAGLPLSVQIVAGPGQDHLTLSAAEIIETAFGGWTPPENL